LMPSFPKAVASFPNSPGSFFMNNDISVRTMDKLLCLSYERQALSHKLLNAYCTWLMARRKVP
jgi:hypothetical protein